MIPIRLFPDIPLGSGDEVAYVPQERAGILYNKSASPLLAGLEGVHMQHHTVAIIIIVMLVLFKIYRHARRELRFQKFVKGRALLRIALMVSLEAVLLATGYANPARYFFDAVGSLLGGLIACYSIRTSAFEWRNNDWFYRQNSWIGKCIFVILAGRFIHKGYEDIYALFAAAANAQFTQQVPSAEYVRDPSLTGIMFVLIAYYIVFYTLLIRREQQMQPAEKV